MDKLKLFIGILIGIGVLELIILTYLNFAYPYEVTIQKFEPIARSVIG